LPSTSGAEDPHDPTWERLEDQIRWYAHRSRYSQRLYTGLKLLELAAAAALPVMASLLHSTVLVTGGLGATIVVLEGAQALYQFQESWSAYRSAAMALQKERFLYLAKAGPYMDNDRHMRLAERIEDLVSQDHTRWTVSHQNPIQHE
jgi:hypothetical protein